jgi:putative acetyltransferase
MNLDPEWLGSQGAGQHQIEMSAEYRIRRAHPSDASDIAAAHCDSIRSVGPQFYPPSVVEDWEEGLTPDIYVNAMEGGEVFFVAVGQIDNNSAVLGFATHRIDDARDGGSVYVRGMATRRGIGSALLRMVEAHAIGQGATSIHVEASLAGVEFYKANGFEEVGRGDTLLTSGRPIQCVFMRKTLTST